MARPQDEKFVPSHTKAPICGCASIIPVARATSWLSHWSVSIQSRFWTKTL
jgi:hypothetical protein